MFAESKAIKEIKLDEPNHVEIPLLDQPRGLDWEIIDLDRTQSPPETFRETFTENALTCE